MAGTGSSKYQMFTLMNNEFAFDVDLSTVECGLNAALYFVAMDEVSRWYNACVPLGHTY